METTCGRCNGKGEIAAFRHVRGGICFRCWGSGFDTLKEIRGLAEWLVRARREYRNRKAALRRAKTPADRAKLQAELDKIEKLGKKNRRLHDALVADHKNLADRAKEMHP